MRVDRWIHERLEGFKYWAVKSMHTDFAGKLQRTVSPEHDAQFK